MTACHVLAWSSLSHVVGSVFCLTEFTRTEVCLLGPTWSPVGPQDNTNNNVETDWEAVSICNSVCMNTVSKCMALARDSGTILPLHSFF